MSPQDRARFDRMAAELVALRRDVRLTPARWAGPAIPPFVLSVGQGNTLITIGSGTYKGLKYPSADVTTVPSAAPAAIDTACPDGISPAYLISNGGALSLVWIGTRLKPGSAAAVVEMAGSFVASTPVICRSTVSMPISGAPTTFATVYVPFRI